MKQQQVLFFLSQLSIANNIPINYSTSEKMLGSFEPFRIEAEENTLSFMLQRIRLKTDNYPHSHVFFDINRFLILIGVVVLPKEKDNNEYILVGPFASSQATDEDIENYLFECGIGKEARTALRPYLYSNRSLSFEQFLAILAQINLVLNEKNEDKDSFINISSDYRTPELLQPKGMKDEIDVIDSQKLVDDALVQSFNKKLNFVMRNGLVTLLPKFFEDMNKINFNILSGSGNGNFQKMKTTAIGAVFAAQTTALDAGLPTTKIDDLKNYYLNRIEVAKSSDELSKMSGEVIFDFTNLIHENLKYVTSNPTINRAIQYIQVNIYTKLTAGKIAKALHISENYLFLNFKKETKMTLVDFINSEKVKKAEYYLLFTDNSLIDIADFLSFSSQSYFQTIFKKYKGITPARYREMNGSDIRLEKA